MSASPSPHRDADRNLLFGILALHMDFIGRDALIQAMNAWVLDKAKALGQILVEQGALRPDKRDLLEALVQAHLSDELDVDLAHIDESTRFKEDLEADSLDLYTLVQELEDSYGVRITDEQAAQILTVGQAVDFVLSHGVAS